MDLMNRSKKKVRKAGSDEEGFSGTMAGIPREEPWMQGEKAAGVEGGKKKSYLVTLMGEEIVISATDESLKDGEDEVMQGGASVKEDIPRYVIEPDPFKGPNVIPSREEERRLGRPWKKTLIIKLLGKKIGFAFLKKKIDAIWVNNGHVQLIDLGNEFFLARFSAIEDYEFALTGGPWVVFDHYLTVRQWQEEFNPHTASKHP